MFSGQSAKYLGRGDLHDTKYDSMVISSSFFDLKSFEIRASKYSGAPIDQEYCPFTINMYPSDEMKYEFTSSVPIILTVTAICIFAFTSIVFVIYDCKVERRQQRVLNTATKTNAIVTSLFPSAIRDKMLQDGEEVKPSKFHFLSKPSHVSRGTVSNEFSACYSYEKHSNILSSKPLADFYPETTVVFADIAGFTAWSSLKSPCEVFTLLESLYDAIDRIALQRKVFKVETIGDCYVAVTGLPDPDPNHAVIMAKFARDILHKMPQVMQTLETILGPETMDLTLRVGLNSGPTTAGVLRGEKSRFQLFGETVNIAARIESNGAPGRIHISQRTADLLMTAGKSVWMTQREDLIEAKSKGKMATFWLHPKRHSSGSTEASSIIGPTFDVDDIAEPS
jgi:class 3 adenylate cyclase